MNYSSHQQRGWFFSKIQEEDAKYLKRAHTQKLPIQQNPLSTVTGLIPVPLYLQSDQDKLLDELKNATRQYYHHKMQRKVASEQIMMIGQQAVLQNIPIADNNLELNMKRLEEQEKDAVALYQRSKTVLQSALKPTRQRKVRFKLT